MFIGVLIYRQITEKHQLKQLCTETDFNYSNSVFCVTGTSPNLPSVETILQLAAARLAYISSIL